MDNSDDAYHELYVFYTMGRGADYDSRAIIVTLLEPYELGQVRG